MKTPARSVHPDHSKWGPIQIATGYLLLGGLWILFSDELAAQIAPNTEVLAKISIYKGWGYVLVTAILLYWLIKKNAVSIRNANQKYKLIAENASDVIWLVDPAKGRFTYVSPSVLKLRGYTAEEVMSQPLNEAYLPEDVERLSRLTLDRISLFQAKGSGAVSYVDEIDQPHRDGSVVHTEVTTTYLSNDQKEIEIMGVTRDITRRKQAEMKQRASEKKYQDLLEQASDGILIANTSGTYTFVNEQACQLVGYTKDELLSMKIRDLVAPEDLENTPLRLDELRDGKILITERKLLCKDESRIVCEISSKMLPDGSFQSIIRDITERKVTEEALVRSERRYRSLFENMSNGYSRCQMLYDEDGRPIDFIYLDVNKSFRKTTGLQNVIGRRVSELIPGIHKTNPDLLETYGRVASTGKPEKFETYVPGLGTGIWFSVSVYSSEKGFFVAVFETITERKRAEESLKQSYKQLLSFIEQAPLSITMFDRDMNYLAVSRRWIQEYGRGHTDLVGRNHYELNPDMPDSWKEAHQKGLAGESLKNDDDLWVQADGTKNWLRWALTPWMDSEGKIGGIIISSEDISERKRAEAAAFKSEMRYHHILDAMMEGCQIIDFDWKYVYVNDVVANQGRHTRQELLNHTMMEMYPGIEKTELFHMLRQCMEDREPTRMENQFVFPDGSIGWFELSIQPAEEGIFILSTDITERKLAEKQLQENERRYRELVQNANSAILRWKRDGAITFFNEYAQTLFGYTSQEILGKDVNILVPKTESTGGDLSRLVENIIENPEQFVNVVNENICHDGHRVWMTWTNKPIYDENGDVSEILAVGVDITERKQAETALIQSEHKFSILFEKSAFAASLSRISDGAIVDVNESFEMAFGYAKQDAIGKTSLELGINPNAEGRQRILAALKESDSAHNLELILRTKSGESRVYSVNVDIVTIDGQKYILNTARDITESKQAEEAITRLAKFPSENPNPVMRVDMNGTLLYANSASAPFLEKWEIQIGQCVPADWVEMIMIIQQSGRIQEIEVDLHGRMFTCIFTPIPDASYINIYGNDITERKRAEEQVRYQANLLSYVSDAIFSTDEKQVIVSWNRAAKEMYGWSAEEAIGKPASRILQSDFTDDQRADAIKALTETGRFKIEILQYHRNGEPLWVEGETIALTDQAGKTTGFVAVNRNITERKQAEEEIQRLNEDLEARVIERTSQLAAANKELESFSYSVSHDLRAPLRAIDGYTNILMEDYKSILDEEGRRICGVISRESKRMGRLIDDLLSFSRMGRWELHFQHIDMKALVDSVLEDVLRLNDRSRIELRVADLHPAMGDNALMRQVWVNLLSNAVKFTSRKKRAIIEVDSSESEEGVIYTVRDNGAGFEMEYVNKLFGVFQRLHGESEFEGTGVGLAIVQRVIHRHGGRVWAEGKVDDGATFQFLLPKRNEQA